MSLCNLCPDPGMCCKGMLITLNGYNKPYSHSSLEYANSRFVNFPQVAVGHTSEGYVLFDCPLLLDGRCTDYDNRPGMCGENYPPGLNNLCFFHGKIFEGYAEFYGEGIA